MPVQVHDIGVSKRSLAAAHPVDLRKQMLGLPELGQGGQEGCDQAVRRSSNDFAQPGAGDYC
ncbi:hypothetical protein AO263_13850 [Pseudomonas sp. NZIPFR-PS5]|nr:hypothetical protein AO263_13850 [Pseudomonas sp. NZIPFR-PS5]